MRTHEAACRLIDTHDALKRHDDREPADVDENSPHADQLAWLAWYEDHKPLRQAWKVAMAQFRALVPECTSDHPMNFRPMALAIIHDPDHE
jgi:hypothetical protein